MTGHDEVTLPSGVTLPFVEVADWLNQACRDINLDERDKQDDEHCRALPRHVSLELITAVCGVLPRLTNLECEKLLLGTDQGGRQARRYRRGETGMALNVAHSMLGFIQDMTFPELIPAIAHESNVKLSRIEELARAAEEAIPLVNSWYYRLLAVEVMRQYIDDYRRRLTKIGDEDILLECRQRFVELASKREIQGAAYIANQ